MKIALIGSGAMGRLVRSIAEDKGHEIVAVVGRADAGLSAEELSGRLRGAHAAVDFTSAEAVRRNVEACVLAGVPIVEGTTGWNAEKEDLQRIVEEGNGTMVYGANFSIGVNLFYQIAEFAAQLLSDFPEYEVFIEEQHHSRKKDSPSGTALRIKEIVAGHVGGDVEVSATRAGNIPGTHRLGFDGPSDQILLTHTARSREGFAIGAIRAAEWAADKKGFFEFSEVLRGLE